MLIDANDAQFKLFQSGLKCFSWAKKVNKIIRNFYNVNLECFKEFFLSVDFQTCELNLFRSIRPNAKVRILYFANYISIIIRVLISLYYHINTDILNQTLTSSIWTIKTLNRTYLGLIDLMQSLEFYNLLIIFQSTYLYK